MRLARRHGLSRPLVGSAPRRVQVEAGVEQALQADEKPVAGIVEKSSPDVGDL